MSSAKFDINVRLQCVTSVSQVIIGSENGLPSNRQTHAGLSLTGPLETNFGEIFIDTQPRLVLGCNFFSQSA